MERRDLDTLRKNALSSATRLVLLQAFDEAIDVLQQFAAQVPGDTAIEERLLEVKRLYAAHVARQEFERAVAEGKELLRRGNYKQAVEYCAPARNARPKMARSRGCWLTRSSRWSWRRVLPRYNRSWSKPKPARRKEKSTRRWISPDRHKRWRRTTSVRSGCATPCWRRAAGVKKISR